MAGSVNKVILVGNLGRDPEVRFTQSNQKIVHLSVATSERWRDKGSGEQKERTEWHRVVLFNERLAEAAEELLTTGRSAGATSERWRDKGSGEQKERTEWHRVVIFNERLAEVAEKFLTKGGTVYL